MSVGAKESMMSRRVRPLYWSGEVVVTYLVKTVRPAMKESCCAVFSCRAPGLPISFSREGKRKVSSVRWWWCRIVAMVALKKRKSRAEVVDGWTERQWL